MGRAGLGFPKCSPRVRVEGEGRAKKPRDGVSATRPPHDGRGNADPLAPGHAAEYPPLTFAWRSITPSGPIPREAGLPTEALRSLATQTSRVSLERGVPRNPCFEAGRPLSGVVRAASIPGSQTAVNTFPGRQPHASNLSDDTSSPLW